MATIPAATAYTTSDLHILAYAYHMATTCRSEAARKLFESYMEHERQWLEQNGHYPAPSASGTLGVSATRPTAKYGGR